MFPGYREKKRSAAIYPRLYGPVLDVGKTRDFRRFVRTPILGTLSPDLIDFICSSVGFRS